MHLVHSFHVAVSGWARNFSLHLNSMSILSRALRRIIRRLSQPQTLVRTSFHSSALMMSTTFEIMDVALIARGAVSKKTDGAVADDGAKSNAQHETRDQHHSGGLLRERNCIFHRPSRATCVASSKNALFVQVFSQTFIIRHLTHFSLSGDCARS